MAAEILLANSGVRAQIRDGKAHQIYSAIQTGGRMGMCTMAQSLAALVQSGKIQMADAEVAIGDPSELHSAVKAA
jgi:twitching motility protein PilT